MTTRHRRGTRTTAPTYRRTGDPTAGTRPECWEATSTDGAWTYLRTEQPGTPWDIVHTATGYVLHDHATSLPDAEELTAGDGIWRTLWADAAWRLDAIPQHPGIAAVTPHDTARALLTWLTDEGHAPNPVDRVTATR